METTWLTILLSADYWLERYQTLLVGLGAIYIAAQQVKLMKTQEAIVAKQQVMTEAQAKASIRSAMMPILRFTDGGMGKHFSPWSAPVEVLDIGYEASDFMSLVAVGYPDLVEEYAALLSALAEYQAASSALPAETRSKAEGAIWFPGMDGKDEADRYVKAIHDLKQAAAPLHSHFMLSEQFDHRQEA